MRDVQRDAAYTPPPDPRTPAKARQLRGRMASARKRSRGDPHEALEEAQAIEREAETLGYLPAVAESLQLRGELEMVLQELEVARETLQIAARTAKKAEHHAVEALAWIQLAHVERQLEGDRGEADTAIRSAEEVLKHHEDLDTLLVLLHNVKGLRHLDRGDAKGAIESLQEAIILGQELFGANHPRLAGLLSNMGEAYRSRQEFVAARELFRHSEKIFKTCFGKESPQAAAPLAGWAQTLLELNEVDEALDHLRRQLNAYERAYGKKHGRLAKTHSLLGRAYGQQGAFEKAEFHHDMAVNIAGETYGESHWRYARGLCYRGETLRRQQKYDAAREDLDRGSSIYARQVHANDAELAWIRRIAGLPPAPIPPLPEAVDPTPGVTPPSPVHSEASEEAWPTRETRR